MARDRSRVRPSASVGRFPPGMVFRAARMYYLEDATQAQIASELGTSRPTVSRLLTEARATGVVHIEVRDPEIGLTDEIEERLCAALGLRAAYVARSTAGVHPGLLLGEPAGWALQNAELAPGDALLVSSGATVRGVVRQPLPQIPGVFVYPTSGGVNEPNGEYQTNEIALTLAANIAGSPVLLHAPALPSPDLFRALTKDGEVQQVIRAWTGAKAALLGVGAPLTQRTLVPSIFSLDRQAAWHAIGDICMRPFDAEGCAIDFDGADRLLSMSLDSLRAVPHTIALAMGAEKVPSLLAAARSRYFNTLVTDSVTANLLIEAAVGSI